MKTEARRIDLADATLRELAGLAGGIAALLRAPNTRSNDALVATLDDLLGAVYALIWAHERGFRGKAGRSEFEPVLTRATDLANGDMRETGNWMAGFHFNNAMFRISAIFDRLPKALAGDSNRAAAEYLKRRGSAWVNTDAHAIRTQVNDLKHEPHGTYVGRKPDADMPTALAAVNQMLDLARALA